MIEAAGGIAVVSAERIPGGDISEAWRLELADGRSAFAKRGGGADLVAEAAGLRWLAEPGAIAVPSVLEAGEDALVLEWIESGGSLDVEALGRGLAGLHRAGAASHGALPPGVGELRIGPLAFPGAPSGSFAEFYGEVLLRPLLSAEATAVIGRLIDRLPELIPDEPAARLHGDLWSGNVMAGADGRPWLIDPAPYGGHREVDLAMLALFGAPGERFFAAYGEVWPLADGWRERVGLWQLFPLLVHAALFGGGYAARAVAVARAYG